MPGTSERMNSSARSDRIGPTPASTVHWSVSPRSRTSAIHRANTGTSKTNWVCTNSAPAATFLASRSARNRCGAANGFSTAPISQDGGGVTVRPPSSRPESRSVRAAPTSVTQSRSKTGLAPGWSPKRGWSPVSSSTLGMPSSPAPSRSDCSAIRLRSRQVSCITGSSPARWASTEPAIAAGITLALGLSVTLTASTQPDSSPGLGVDPIRVDAVRQAELGGDREPAGLDRAAQSRGHAALAGGGPDRQPGPYALGVGPQVLVAALPVVDPAARPGQPVVDRPLQQGQVLDVPGRLGPLVRDHPDAAQLRVDLAGAVGGDPAARPVAQLLRAGLRAGVAGRRQRALAAHPAAERPLLDRLLGGRERPPGPLVRLQPVGQPAVDPVGREQVVEQVVEPGRQPRDVRAGPAGPRRDLHRIPPNPPRFVGPVQDHSRAGHGSRSPGPNLGAGPLWSATAGALTPRTVGLSDDIPLAAEAGWRGSQGSWRW